jgi:hypothetical protein
VTIGDNSREEHDEDDEENILNNRRKQTIKNNAIHVNEVSYEESD